MREQIILAIDTSQKEEAEKLAKIAQTAGAHFIKLGLELSSATSWHYCSDLATRHDLGWVADAKLNDIPNTVSRVVKNISNLEHPPFGITMHTLAGSEAMYQAQKAAGIIKMLGVTILTSLSYEEVAGVYRTTPRRKVWELAQSAVEAGLLGVVASPQEVSMIKSNPKTQELFAMIPGTRSVAAQAEDQARTTTPAAAIKAGADLLVIGRQITRSEDPARAYEDLVAEIEAA